jgi:hypothetical protein
VRRNRYPGKCTVCGQTVHARAGWLTGTEGAWKVRHENCAAATVHATTTSSDDRARRVSASRASRQTPAQKTPVPVVAAAASGSPPPSQPGTPGPRDRPRWFRPGWFSIVLVVGLFALGMATSASDDGGSSTSNVIEADEPSARVTAPPRTTTTLSPADEAALRRFFDDLAEKERAERAEKAAVDAYLASLARAKEQEKQRAIDAYLRELENERLELTCPNGTYVNTNGNTVCSPYAAPSAPAGASAICRDGTYSFSQNNRGTCSHHGGVAQWL